MKNGKRRASERTAGRVELGEYIVTDPEICHGKPTFKGTRIMVWQVLDALGRGESTDEIVESWDGKISKGAIATASRRMGVVARIHHDGIHFWQGHRLALQTAPWVDQP